MSQPLDSTLELSRARVARVSLAELATIREGFKNARTTTIAPLTNETGRLAKLAAYENVSLLVCPSLDQDMEEDQIGSRFTA